MRLSVAECLHVCLSIRPSRFVAAVTEPHQHGSAERHVEGLTCECDDSRDPASDCMVAQCAILARVNNCRRGFGTVITHGPRVAFSHLNVETGCQRCGRSPKRRVVRNQEQRSAAPNPVADGIAFSVREGRWRIIDIGRVDARSQSIRDHQHLWLPERIRREWLRSGSETVAVRLKQVGKWLVSSGSGVKIPVRFIKDKLKTIRKLNGIVGFGTQSASDIVSSKAAGTLIEQSATNIFFPNPKADESSYKKAFNLSDREFRWIKESVPEQRQFIIKTAGSSVIAKLNLAGMPDLIKVLSGRKETVNELHGLMERLGPDPKAWLPEFLQNERRA